MITAAWISDAWAGPHRTVRTRNVDYWLSVFGLACADALSFFITYLLFRHSARVPALVLFFGNNPNKASTPLDVFVLLAMSFISVRYLCGDYSRRQLFWDGAKLTTIALLITAVPDIVMLILGKSVYSATAVLLSWAFLLLILPIVRQMARIFMTRLGVWQIPTALIGVSARSAEIGSALRSSLSLGFDLRWLVVEDSAVDLPNTLSNLKPIHSTDAARIAAVICSEGCKEAIVAAEDMQSTHFADVVQRLLEFNVPVAIIPSINRLPLANATTNYFFGSDILLMQVRSNVQRLPSRFVKRIFDIIVSSSLLVLLAPLFAVLGILIKRSSPGPVTYLQERIGRHGKSFDCIKFRTMVQDADACLQRWSLENPDLYQEYLKSYKLRDDPRITRIGKWLRRTSLDELPQLWNVLRGDMSLVGPRPIVRRELDEYYGPAGQLYVRTRPGLTGLWQVSGRSSVSYERRILLDEWYILNWSFWYDIVILIQTAWIVLTGKGAF